jgi:hypothetical protein
MIWTAVAAIVGPRRNRFLLLAVAMLAAASCAYQPAPNASDPPGFFMGLVHGFLILFSFRRRFYRYSHLRVSEFWRVVRLRISYRRWLFSRRRWGFF